MTLQELQALLDFLKTTPAMQSKMKIAEGLTGMPKPETHRAEDLYALPGDDTAAIATKNGYLLHACEGMIPTFVEQHPYFAGWSAVMANVSDIAAMGGRACSVVNSFWHRSAEQAQQLMQGMQAASTAYGVPLVGGHTHIDATLQPNLSVAIQGQAEKLLSVMHVRSGQKIILVLDLDGQFHPNTAYWKCFEHKTSVTLQRQLELLPYIAEQGLAYAARDISNAGILGSLLMLLEASGSGADIQLHAIQKPEQVSWQHWLQIFPSYGFLLTADEQHCEQLMQCFNAEGLACQVIGETNASGQIDVHLQHDSARFWDFNQEPFTGLNYRDQIKKFITSQYLKPQELRLCQA